MKKFFVFLAITFVSVLTYADDCVTVPSGFSGNATITFKRYTHKVLTGAFQINGSGKQVVFAQGNLQYRASTDKWRFAENQYDMIGSDNLNVDTIYDGWIDLFGWGCSGWNSGATEYLPYSISTTATEYGRGSRSLVESETPSQAHADWAYHNAIINGGDSDGPAAELWRTLTSDEWNYILNDRADADLKRSPANVCGVDGYILLPDSWSLPAGLDFEPDAPEYDINVYDETDWGQMEANGAVFLPAAGYRRANVEMRGVGYGYYWSTTHRSNNYAYYFKFMNDSYNAAAYQYRIYGSSVRPVQEL